MNKSRYDGSEVYAWNWVGGGYNWCRANSIEEAIEKGEDGCDWKMQIKRDSIVTGKEAEAFIAEMDRAWRSLFYQNQAPQHFWRTK